VGVGSFKCSQQYQWCPAPGKKMSQQNNAELRRMQGQISRLLHARSKGDLPLWSPARRPYLAGTKECLNRALCVAIFFFGGEARKGAGSGRRASPVLHYSSLILTDNTTAYQVCMYRNSFFSNLLESSLVQYDISKYLCLICVLSAFGERYNIV
jgi:hypothetical protein